MRGHLSYALACDRAAELRRSAEKARRAPVRQSRRVRWPATAACRALSSEIRHLWIRGEEA